VLDYIERFSYVRRRHSTIGYISPVQFENLLAFQKVKSLSRYNVEMKCKRSSDDRKLDHHTLQVIRQQAVKAVREGQSVANVAAAYGLSIRTIFSWLAKFADGGQNALLAKPISDHPPKISADEMRWIAQAVRDNSPQQFKFEFGLWPLSLIGGTGAVAEPERRGVGGVQPKALPARHKARGVGLQHQPGIERGDGGRSQFGTGAEKGTLGDVTHQLGLDALAHAAQQHGQQRVQRHFVVAGERVGEIGMPRQIAELVGTQIFGKGEEQLFQHGGQ
jgi:hypothetical protein